MPRTDFSGYEKNSRTTFLIIGDDTSAINSMINLFLNYHLKVKFDDQSRKRISDEIDKSNKELNTLDVNVKKTQKNLKTTKRSLEKALLFAFS